MGSQAGTTTERSPGREPPSPAFRFGKASGPRERSADGWSVQWQLRRNCSMAPAQLLAIYAAFCVLAFGIAGMFWWQGASLVLPFATLEVAAVGLALLIYARHAADCESIRLQQGSLVVERAHGRRTERIEFQPDWVRVEPEHGDGSLIELSGRGQKISVGRFVRPELRRQLADELRWALRRWRAEMAPDAA